MYLMFEKGGDTIQGRTLFKEIRYADGHVYLDRKNKKVKKLIIRAFICTFVHLKMLNHSYDVNYQAIFEIGTSIKQMSEA